jgi:hypothetical protein
MTNAVNGHLSQQAAQDSLTAVFIILSLNPTVADGKPSFHVFGGDGVTPWMQSNPMDTNFRYPAYAPKEPKERTYRRKVTLNRRTYATMRDALQGPVGRLGL